MCNTFYSNDQLNQLHSLQLSSSPEAPQLVYVVTLLVKRKKKKKRIPGEKGSQGEGERPSQPRTENP